MLLKSTMIQLENAMTVDALITDFFVVLLAENDVKFLRFAQTLIEFEVNIFSSLLQLIMQLA